MLGHPQVGLQVVNVLHEVLEDAGAEALGAVLLHLPQLPHRGDDGGDGGIAPLFLLLFPALGQGAERVVALQVKAGAIVPVHGLQAVVPAGVLVLGRVFAGNLQGVYVIGQVSQPGQLIWLLMV